MPFFWASASKLKCSKEFDSAKSRLALMLNFFELIDLRTVVFVCSPFMFSLFGQEFPLGSLCHYHGRRSIRLIESLRHLNDRSCLPAKLSL